MKRFDGTMIPEAEAKKFRECVDKHRWIFAKTYASFCPHEYTLKREYWTSEDFKWFVKFVWDNGFWAKYGKNEAKYFIDDETGYYYFVSPADMTDTGEAKTELHLINRSSLKEFEFVEENSLFGTEIKVKRLQKEKRGKAFE